MKCIICDDSKYNNWICPSCILLQSLSIRLEFDEYKSALASNMDVDFILNKETGERYISPKKSRYPEFNKKGDGANDGRRSKDSTLPTAAARSGKDIGRVGKGHKSTLPSREGQRAEGTGKKVLDDTAKGHPAS